MRPYLQTRSIYTIGYEVEKRCCVGYTKNGTQCQKACDRGQYGKDCNKTCNCSNTPNTDGYCNQTTGGCICNPGWLGEYCSQSCPDGTYGSGCSNQCECEEEGTESCDPVDGSCNCKPGKTGIMCEYECPFETYGYGCKNNCSCNNLQEYCRPSDGQCIKKCFCARDGTANCDNNHDDCKCKQQKRQKCISANFVEERFDMYTDAIIDTCACKNGFDNVCVPKNGTCICKHGYTGEWCNDVVSDSNTDTKSLIHDNNSVIIGPVIGSLIATVVIVIVVLLILRKTSCKKKVKKPTSMSDPVLSDSIAKNDQLYENANVPQTLEKAKFTKTDEKVKFTQAVKKANVAQINEKAKESQTYENLNAAETYEELNIAEQFLRRRRIRRRRRKIKKKKKN